MHRIAILVLMLSSSIAAAAAPVWVTPKHRAAPPEQMLPGGLLAPVASAEVPLESQGAMLRVDLDGDGLWQGVLPIDAPGKLRIMPISEAGDALVLTLEDGNGQIIRLTPDTRDVAAQTSEVPGVGSFTGYIVPIPRAAVWQISVAAPVGTKSVYLAYATDGPVLLRSARVTDRTVVGIPMTYRASVHSDEGAAPLRDVQMSLLVTSPDGDRFTVQMRGDGQGTFSGAFTPEITGRFVVQVVVQSDFFLRTAQHMVNVVSADIAVGGSSSGSLREASNTMRIEIAARDGGRVEHCRVSAQIWGQDGQGNAVPVCWVGGMTLPQHDRQGHAILALDVDARWIALANVVGPYELRSVEVRCPRTMTMLSHAEVLPLALDFPVERIAAPVAVTDDMRTAPRSDDLAFVVDVDVPARSRVAGGHNLLLIHGYCAGGNPWPLSDFSGAIEIFSDPDANRSHDEFALLIKALADTTKSSGVVAHSQGGAAALHLYTYYFSALDWAEGSRLIQSLGTPYQGTPLAGNLSLLGDIFGSGCGENTDLSVDGAAVWLSGIPSDARARVHYWTTSSQGAWCNFFSGLFLTNPEDGVVEVSRGQLPGGNSMGNTVGQCHTTGMSDPAQYLDSTRNSEMNANAAR